ncbi:hypothetical protein BC567DRAFT_230870 [Phyllosticta citribraziliensis]
MWLVPASTSYPYLPFSVLFNFLASRLCFHLLCFLMFEPASNGLHTARTFAEHHGETSSQQDSSANPLTTRRHKYPHLPFLPRRVQACCTVVANTARSLSVLGELSLLVYLIFSCRCVSSLLPARWQAIQNWRHVSVPWVFSVDRIVSRDLFVAFQMSI